MDIIESWFEQTKSLSPGESLFIECHSKQDARSMLGKFKHIRSDFMRINPVIASSIEIRTTFKDKKFWLVMTKLASSPLVGFKKGIDGSLTKVTLGEDMDRERRIKLMIMDGMELNEVEQNIGGLTKEEVEIYFNKEN